MSTSQQFGATVRKLRASKGLSQEALADAAGVHRTYVGSIERGERNPTLSNVVRIAAALGLRTSELLKAMEIES